MTVWQTTNSSEREMAIMEINQEEFLMDFLSSSDSTPVSVDSFAFVGSSLPYESNPGSVAPPVAVDPLVASKVPKIDQMQRFVQIQYYKSDGVVYSICGVYNLNTVHTNEIVINYIAKKTSNTFKTPEHGHVFCINVKKFSTAIGYRKKIHLDMLLSNDGDGQKYWESTIKKKRKRDDEIHNCIQIYITLWLHGRALLSLSKDFGVMGRPERSEKIISSLSKYWESQGTIVPELRVEFYSTDRFADLVTSSPGFNVISIPSSNIPFPSIMVNEIHLSN